MTGTTVPFIEKAKASQEIVPQAFTNVSSLELCGCPSLATRATARANVCSSCFSGEMGTRRRIENDD